MAAAWAALCLDTQRSVTIPKPVPSLLLVTVAWYSLVKALVAVVALWCLGFC